ncbi:uncharacterized protein LOC129328693 [Eublepharis macularius]|uniref:Uncharacterized protein LOC129328693 n=1 Tax=Eublepharis macularius TaxID=481883 RepID=A0AA97KWS4_EUBMA|nr:uncharacterized protein LOC129328693 [Eublepharis macularius]
MQVTEERPRSGSPGTGHELLEELLTYDDLFLECFNAFLALPAFPLRLHYDRLTGWLQDLDGFLWNSSSHLEAGPSSLCYGATDAERERTLGWLWRERFLPFTRTAFYLEYKLAKLLLCPLDGNYPESRYELRGYSRQSDSAAVSSIPSHPSTTRQPTGVPSHVLLRLPSQTRSSPACLGHLTSFSGQSPIQISMEFPGILSLGQFPVTGHLSRLQFQSLRSDSSIEKTKERLMSGFTSADEPVFSPVPLNRAVLGSSPDEELTKLQREGSCEKIFSEPRKVLQFDLNEANITEEGQMDPCLSDCFGSAVLQQLKEDLLGTKAGMNSFREFLHGTLGIYLLDFWIDCEDFMEHTRHLEARATPQETWLFCFSALRSIQAKYKLTVPPAFQEPFGEAAGTQETAFAAMKRKQYDALRRLRSYWVPRFLIHHQRTTQLRLGDGSDFQIKEEILSCPGFPASLNVPSSLSVVGSQRDTMNYVKRNKDWRCNNLSRDKGRSRFGSNKQHDVPPDPFEILMTTRFLQVLMCDLGDGDSFLHYLTRFEDPGKVHNLLLWRKLKLYEAACEQQASQPELRHIAQQIFHIFLAPYAGCNTGLSSSMPEYIQNLERLLCFGYGDLTTSTFEPLSHYLLGVLGGVWFQYLRHEVAAFLEYCIPASYFDTQSTGSKNSRVKLETNERIKKQERLDAWVQNHDTKGGGLHRKRHRKKAVLDPQRISTMDQETKEKSPTPQSQHVGSADHETRERLPTPESALDLLSNSIVLKVYRKAVQKMQDVELQRILKLLQEVEACQDKTQSKKGLGCVLKLLDTWDQLGAVGMRDCFPKDLKMRLNKEVAQGEISDYSWSEIRIALRSFIAPAFEKFWEEVSEGLKKHGVQPSQIPEERWCKLEPFLHLLAAKVALRSLRKRKAKDGSAATAKPTREDKTCFWQALRHAAEGWPTLEVLHFLRHLQVHSSPVLESGLHFLLEVEKFKNAHHAWPDLDLLKKKILVIRDCFLASQIEPRLQVAVDAQRLGRAIQAAEKALQKEIPVPPPSLFDELKNSVFNILLPYWAAFQKYWLKRSPASAQKAPVLRNQRFLQKRGAIFESPQQLPQSLLLPPLQPPTDVQRAQDGFTYTFSISRGLILQDIIKEGRSHSKTSSVFGNRNRSTGFHFSSLSNVPALI